MRGSRDKKHAVFEGKSKDTFERETRRLIYIRAVSREFGTKSKLYSGIVRWWGDKVTRTRRYEKGRAATNTDMTITNHIKV